MKSKVIMTAIFIAIGCMLSYAVVAQNTPAPNKHITFTQPEEFVCGQEVTWDQLEDWVGKMNTSICGSEPYYHMTGRVTGLPGAYRILAEIYVPEAHQSWPTSGSGYRLIDKTDGTFSGDFCIPEKGPAREFRFQVYNEQRAAIGEPCVITVPEKW